MLARSKYLTRHHRALMVMAVAWEKKTKSVKLECEIV